MHLFWLAKLLNFSNFNNFSNSKTEVLTEFFQAKSRNYWFI